MYCLAILLVGVVVLVKPDVDQRHCLETAALNTGCCQYNITEETAILKECTANSDRDTGNCKFETCYLQKSGFLTSNGTIDETLFEAWIEKEFKNYTDLKEIVKEKCLVGDTALYGPPNMCYVKKIWNCFRVHSTLNCPQWEETKHCNEVKDILKECESVFP